MKMNSKTIMNKELIKEIEQIKKELNNPNKSKEEKEKIKYWINVLEKEI